jgi:ribosome-binding factor A
MNPHHPERAERVAEQYREALSPLLQDYAESNTLITLIRVETDEKGSFARAYISVLPDAVADKTVKKLADETKEIRRELAEKLNKRHVPELRFLLSSGEKETNALRKLQADDTQQEE